MSHRSKHAPIRILATSFILLTAAAGSAAADALDSFQPAWQVKAERALELGEPERALAVLAAPEQAPTNRRDLAELHGLRCEAQLALDRPVEAIGSCLAAIDTRSGAASWRFHNNLGVAHLTVGEFDQAERAFRNARTLNARSTAPRRNLKLLSAIRDEGTMLLGQALVSAR